MVVGGRNMHSQEFDRFSRGRETQAGVGKHHNAERNQKNCNDGFHIKSIIDVWLMAGTFAWLHRSPAGNEPEQNHNNGNDEKEVNEAAHSGTAHQAQRPQDEQYYCNGI